MSSDAIERAADALFAAWRDRTPLASATELGVAVKDLEAAYAVQAALHRRFLAHGRRQVGWKVGVTSPAALAAMGAAEPMVGIIYADSVLADGATFDTARGCAPKLEGELLVELSARSASVDPQGAGIKEAIASIRPAFEIADSRFAGWATTIAPAIADNACCGWLVPGDEGRSPTGFDDAAVAMTMTLDGVAVSGGSGADCLGGAFNVVRWFLTHARRRKLELSSGQWLLTGAMGPAVPSPRSGRAQVTLGGLGTVAMQVGEG
jgi:2-keto-4-pentenoate hydratase